MKSTAIQSCRICGNTDLNTILDLGKQALTGIFPRSRNEPEIAGPLELIKCSPPGCGLVQLRHDADLELMYGERYGYRSSIRPFMINHLADKVEQVTSMVTLDAGDVVLDIGSNDATLLHAYRGSDLQLVGCDPSAEKFRDRYPSGSELIVDFFSAAAYRDRMGDRSARIVTSIACFYDLQDPTQFMRDVRSILAEDGIWMIEHNYLRTMLEANCYDNICHEHLEFYAFAQIELMASMAGLKVLSSEVTDVYGGSLCTVLAKDTSTRSVDDAGLQRLRDLETEAVLDSMAPFEAFAGRIKRHRDELREFLDASAAAGKLTLGYGASTKGNVLLQYCEITEQDLPCIGEVSAEKSGCLTPGSRIPIVSEEAAKAHNPDQLLVLPWVYRDGFIEREQDFLANGGKLVFPLPELDSV
ncbi:methyltransferase (plasmid) [Pseudonocardia sp. EC080610-09]|uniref:class I SAM-dependent methyltransferase n=1 Tax=unclassified Pseudonocardia TaxID=2619320 RepID=UPI000705D2F2|nr:MULTISPECIES: class I SAM-dependent methyltransferase [unclassified Pseudonocardia]ALL79475.1 methyltransferase [Pseudonocardia sp. EC080610-09]ALL85572.1 methyltransferase [Pseudonocardia sp. EC080619-01]